MAKQIEKVCENCLETFWVSSRAPHALYCQKPECRAEGRRASVRKVYDKKRKGIPIGQRSQPYIDPLIKILIYSLRRAYRDATLEFDDELGEEIPPDVRQDAWQYLREDAPDILACMGVQIEIPMIQGD